MLGNSSRRHSFTACYISILILLSLCLSSCNPIHKEPASLLLPCLTLHCESAEHNVVLQPSSDLAPPEHIYWAPDTQTNSDDLKWSRQSTTPEVFQLSATEIIAAESAALAGDAKSAYRLANHYGFALRDWSLYLRWCATSAELGGPKEAAVSIETFHISGTHTNSVVQAFALTEADVKALKERVHQQHDAKSAFRLALFYGYSLNDTEQRDNWLQTAATMGSIGASLCVEAWRVHK